MFCSNCGNPVSNNDKFCKKCGTTNPGFKETPASNTPNPKNTMNYQKKTAPKKDKKSLTKVLAIIVALVVIISAVVGLLVYFDKLDIPFINDIFISTGLKDNKTDNPDTSYTDKETPPDTEATTSTAPYKLNPIDTDEYFEQNSTVISKIDVYDSEDIHSEADAYDNFEERGFTEYPIKTSYSIDGDYYDEEEIYGYYSEEHPMYETYYVTKNEDIWYIYEVNGTVMANPLSYNLNSQTGVEVIISESDTITSYDNYSNKFYVTKPDESALCVKTVKKINAKTLEKLSTEGIDNYE